MPYCRLFYHFNWTTKYRRAWIVPEIEPILFDTIRSKTIGLGGRVFAVNAVPDHVHLVVSIPPILPISRFIGQVKGISSLRVNESCLLPQRFQWQEEYSVFSVEESRLPVCISYVERQKEHHMGMGKLEPR
jgi:putative transposase